MSNKPKIKLIDPEKLWEVRNAYCLVLKDMDYYEIIKELDQFLVDMMDWTEQSDREEIFTKLQNRLLNI